MSEGAPAVALGDVPEVHRHRSAYPRPVSRHRLVPVGTQDLAWSLGFLAGHAVPGIESWDGRTYRRALTVDGNPVPVALTVVEGALELVGPAAAVPTVRALLGLDDDSGAAEAALCSDPLLGPLVERRPGLRVPGSPDHLETLVRTVVGQQVSLAAAATVTGRIVHAHGEPLSCTGSGADPGADPGGPTHAFPTAQVLAAVDPQTLPMPRSRGRTVVAVATAFAADPGLVHDPIALLALPGIGPWTVDYLRLRITRDPDVLLASDLAVRRQVARLGGTDLTARQVADLAVTWAPHRTTAMLQLWADYLDGAAAG